MYIPIDLWTMSPQRKEKKHIYTCYSCNLKKCYFVTKTTHLSSDLESMSLVWVVCSAVWLDFSPPSETLEGTNSTSPSELQTIVHNYTYISVYNNYLNWTNSKKVTEDAALSNPPPLPPKTRCFFLPKVTHWSYFAVLFTVESCWTSLTTYTNRPPKDFHNSHVQP